MKLQNTTNAFGATVPTPSEVLANDRIAVYLRSSLKNCLSAMGIGFREQTSLADEILRLAITEADLFTREREVHDLIGTHVSEDALNHALASRAAAISGQIAPHLKRGSLLDYGCGDGRIASLLHGQCDGRTVLGDTYEHPLVKSYGFDFVLLPPRGRVPFDAAEFDNVILCTVLHHSDVPLETLDEALRVVSVGGRLVVIESVYGIPQELAQGEWNEATRLFLDLTAEEQFAANMFFDHFYNRSIYYTADPKTKVNVPYNYRTPEAWEAEYRARGALVLATIPLGIDMPLAPLFHILQIVERVL